MERGYANLCYYHGLSPSMLNCQRLAINTTVECASTNRPDTVLESSDLLAASSTVHPKCHRKTCILYLLVIDSDSTLLTWSYPPAINFLVLRVLSVSTTPLMSKSEPIVIVGGGAWGLSTALHLRQSGYTDITVFETADSIPSRYSAAYDINKIVRAEYEESFYTDLALVSSSSSYFNNQFTNTAEASDTSLEGSAVRPLLS